MKSIEETLEAVNWQKISEEMNEKGYARIDSLLSPAACEQLINGYTDPSLFRKTIDMKRYRFGSGEYKYFNYPLPDILSLIRKGVYRGLAPIANQWMNVLGTERKFPHEHEQLQQLCHENGQNKSTVLILKYGQGDHNTLHQDLYGDIFFPMQAVLFLNKPGKDYTGGELVLTQQIPRAQSKATVLQPNQGDMLVFTTNFRPVKGARGYYRANMKHGVSEVKQGNRHTVGIIFHDALN